MRRILVIVFAIAALVALLSCIERKPERIAKKDAPVTGELATVSDIDSALRVNMDIPDTSRNKLNLANREVVYRLLAQALIVEPEDLYRAALILQHAERPAARECCLLAHKLALEAADKGHPKAKFLAAAALDRYLLMSDHPQKFGTQYTRNRAGQYVILPYDSQTPDSVRVAWNVPPLDSLQKALKAMNPPPPTRSRRR